MNSLKTLLVCTVSVALTAACQSAVVYADFNDNAAGTLGSFTAGAGQAGGIGFLAGDVWANTGTVNVVAGDLVAPASTNYGLSQSGTPQSAQGTFAAGRQTTRAIATTMTGTIWFSYLFNQVSIDSRSGITFNQNGSSPGDPRVVAAGDRLRIGLGSLQSAAQGTAVAFNQTYLLVGRLTIDAVGDEVIDLWLDPDVSLGSGALGMPDNTWTGDQTSLDGGITRIGVQSYSSDNMGGLIDALRVSDGPNGFADVTGAVIPEPSASLLLCLAFGGFFLRRQRA